MFILAWIHFFQFFFCIEFAFYLSRLLLQEALLNSAWSMLENKTKTDLESQLNCCGLLNGTTNQAQFNQDLQNCPAVRLTFPNVSLENLLYNHSPGLLDNNTVFVLLLLSHCVWCSLTTDTYCIFTVYLHLIYLLLHNRPRWTEVTEAFSHKQHKLEVGLFL